MKDIDKGSLAPFDQYLGIEILEKDNGASKLSIEYQGELTNPYGYLHGGVITTLADSAMAMAIYSKYPNDIFYTAKTEIRFKSPVDSGEIFAKAKILHKKGNFIYGDIEIYNDCDRLVARVKSVFFLYKEKMGESL